MKWPSGNPAFGCVLLAALLVASSGVGADWPRWCGSGGRNAADETNLPESFEGGERDSHGRIDLKTTRNVKWVSKVSLVVFGNPTVSDGKVFLGTNKQALRNDKRFSARQGGLVLCLSEATGERLWQLFIPERTTGFPPKTYMTQQKWGVCSSPTVDGDRVYVVSIGDEVLCLDIHGLADGNDGPFQDEAQYMAGANKPPVALKSTDADILWKYDIVRELDVAPHDVASCSVLIHGKFLYTSTSNGVGRKHELGCLHPDAPSFLVLDKTTGRKVAVDNEGLGKTLFHAQWSSPSAARVGGRTLIAFGGGDGVCYAFETIEEVTDEPLYLKKVWSYDCNPPEYRLRDGKPIPYYSGDVRKGRSKQGGPEGKLWTNGDGSFVGPSQIISTPVFYKDRVYVAIGQDPAHGRGKGMLHCIDATKTGDITESGKVWSFGGIDRTMSTVAVDNGLVYATDLPGRLFCLDADTGNCLWTHEAKDLTWGGALVADGKVYFNTKRSFWVLAAGKEKKVLATQRIGSEGTPIAANGVVYNVLNGRLWALQKTPGGTR